MTVPEPAGQTAPDAARVSLEVEAKTLRKEVKRLHRLLDLIDPVVVDAAERALLFKEEAEAKAAQEIVAKAMGEPNAGEAQGDQA